MKISNTLKIGKVFMLTVLMGLISFACTEEEVPEKIIEDTNQMFDALSEVNRIIEKTTTDNNITDITDPNSVAILFQAFEVNEINFELPTLAGASNGRSEFQTPEQMVFIEEYVQNVHETFDANSGQDLYSHYLNHMITLNEEPSEIYTESERAQILYTLMVGVVELQFFENHPEMLETSTNGRGANTDCYKFGVAAGGVIGGLAGVGLGLLTSPVTGPFAGVASWKLATFFGTIGAVAGGYLGTVLCEVVPVLFPPSTSGIYTGGCTPGDITSCIGSHFPTIISPNVKVYDGPFYTGG